MFYAKTWRRSEKLTVFHDEHIYCRDRTYNLGLQFESKLTDNKVLFCVYFFKIKKVDRNSILRILGRTLEFYLSHFFTSSRREGKRNIKHEFYRLILIAQYRLHLSDALSDEIISMFIEARSAWSQSRCIKGLAFFSQWMENLSRYNL